MIRSPYPPEASRLRTLVIALGHFALVVIGPWFLFAPPTSYQGLGLAASYGWGVALGVGGLVMLVGHLLRDYRIEMPGILIAGCGTLIYCLLSWQIVLDGSPGSGPRALFLVWGLSVLAVRGMDLWAHRRRLKSIDAIAIKG